MTYTKFLFTLLLLAAMQAFAQSPRLINLQWKINPNDTIAYATTMQVAKDQKAGQEVQANTSTNNNAFRELAQAMAKANSEKSYKTVVYQNRDNAGYLDIAMIELGATTAENAEVKELFSQQQEVVSDVKKDRKKKKKEKDAPSDMPDPLVLQKAMRNLSALNDNIVLRGRISKAGEIISTYYKNSQSNLIAVMFELPGKPVKIGEPWKLSVNLIEMDQNFEADVYIKENQAYIEKVEIENGQEVAEIRYQARERVEGDLNSPMAGLFGGADNGGKTILEVTHTATGRFSIREGKWLSYKGIMTIENSMSMFGGKSATIFELTPIK